MKRLFWLSGIGTVLLSIFLMVGHRRAGGPAAESASRNIQETRPASLTADRSETATAQATQTKPSEAPTPRSDPSTETNALVAFRAWAGNFVNASPDERAALTAEGVTLAQARRSVFKELVKRDPRRALEEAVPIVFRQELPDDVVQWLEARVNGRAALRVYQGVGPDNASPVPTVRMAEFASGETYQAYVYGRRAESVCWLADASLNGVAVDREFAVHEDPFRTLEIGERPDPNKPAVTVCPVSGRSALADEDKGRPITEQTPALEAFGEIVYLCDGSHATVYREQLLYAEGGTGGAMTFTGLLPAAPTPSIGNIKVLVIPLTFADQNDTPSSESVLYQLMRDVGDHYAKASYGKLTLVTTVTPPIRLPHNEAWYVQKDSSNGGPIDGLGLEHSHARAEARKLGYDDEEYDCIVVRLRGGARPVGGWGGGRSVWIYGDGPDVTAHEVGHVFGLAHANFWNTGGSSAIGVGSSEEYGGHWDVMGGIGLPYGHYNVQGKNQIKWLPDAFITEITSSGLYRIYAQDQGILDPAKRFALRIRKDSLRTYWGELRGLYTGHSTRTWADYGLILGWRYPSGSGSNWQLIDTTPGSPFGKDDSPINLGRTFADTEAGVYLTTVAVNPATSEEPKSVDVVVNLGEFPDNHPPTLALAASATVVPLNTPVTFTATAADADGDPLAYSWQHFGDSNYRTISPNAPVITRSFSSAGSYVVTCTVSDMKGGSATRSVLVNVGSGGSRYTITGRVTLNGQGLRGVLVNANSANGVLTDSDGRYVIPNLTAATYVMTPLLYGYNFSELFNNSVAVGPNFTGADFEAAAVARVSITATAPVGNETNTAAPAQFTLTRSGDASQALTVNLASPTGTATRTNDYVMTPAPASGSQGFSTLTIPAGSDTLTVTIAPVNDAAAEGPETVILELGPGNGYLIEGFAHATVVIDDDDTRLPKVSLAVGEAKTVEGTTALATVTFTRTGATTNALAVAYTVGGSAASGDDFVPLSGTLTIPVGATVGTLSITSVDDSTSESLETAAITIASTATFIADPMANTATVSIVDDDVQIVTVAATDAVATERDLSQPDALADTATFLVSRSGDISQPLTVYYAVAGAVSGSVATALHGVDYETLPGVLTIPAGQASGAVTIIPRWDGLGEGPESVTLQLGAGPTNYRLGVPNTATATINDAGDPPYVEVLGTDNAVEPSTAGHFRFSLKGSSTNSVVVSYTLSGTASNGVDFTALPGTVTLVGNGVTTADITVTPLADTLAEDLETITLTLTPGAGYQVFGPSSSATIWMRDDEQPTLFVDAASTSYPPSITENGTGGSFYVSRLGSTNAALTVNYVLSGTASNGVDYQLMPGTTNIAAGARGVDIAVVPINDALAEGTETITLELASGAYGHGAPATFYLTDNETPTRTVGFPSASAVGAENIGTVNLPVTLSSTTATPVTVEYLVDTGARATSTASGSAPSPLPYWVRCDRIGGTMIGSISPDGTNWTGVSTQAVALPSASSLVGLHVCSFNTSVLCTSVFDHIVITNLQPGGTVGLRSSGNIGSTALAGSVSIVGDTYTVSGAGDNVEGTTDQGYFTWWTVSNSTNCTIMARVVSQLNTSPAATAGVMVRESTANNVRRGYMAATSGSGFEFHYRTSTGAQEAKVTRAPARPTWVRLQRAGDIVRAFQSSDGSAWTQVGANLTMAFGAELFAGLAVSAQADAARATATLDNVTLTPGPLPPLLGRTVGFTSNQGIDSLADGIYTISASGDGLNGTHDDFYFLAATATGDFTLTARLTGMQSTAASPQAGLVVRENTTRVARSVFLGGSPGLAPQLIWRTTTTTTAYGVGVDHTLAPGVLTFAPGSTTLNITFNVTDDALPESDEAVTILLRNPMGARLGSVTQFTYVIEDNDSPPALPFVGFASSSNSASEASGTIQVPVTLSVPAAESAAVDYALTAGTATTDGDFAAATGTLNFAAGDTVQWIPVTLLDDAAIEPSETLLLTLSSPVGLRFTTFTNQTFTILDNDSPLVTISSTDTNAAEAGDTATVILTRSGPTDNALTVNLTRSGGASAGTDYTGINATAVIPAGESSVTLTLAPVQDTVAESTETAAISVAAGAGYAVGVPSNVTVFITDDDRNTVTILADTPVAYEGGSSGSLLVTRAGDTNGSLTVSLTLSGTAANGTDYTTTPASIASLVFSPGQTARTITVNPIDDATTESDEAVLVQIGSGSYDIAGPAYASLTIRDNDIPPTVFISSPGAQGVVVAPTNGLFFEATADDDGLPQPLTYQWAQVSGSGVVTFGVTNSARTPATFSAPGVYLVRVKVNDGQFSASDQIAVTVGGRTNLAPADWISADVGPTTLAGFSGPTETNWVLSAAGVGFATSSDRAHAVTRQVTGDGTLIARLTAVSGPTAAEAGLCVRDSMHRYARRAALLYQGSARTLRFRTRVTNNTTDTSVSLVNLSLPLWLKLERVEASDTVTAWYATDNAGTPGPWTQIGNATVIAMDATADFSLTADSGSDTVAATAAFDGVALTPAPSGPATLAEDFGDAAQAGSYAYDAVNDIHTLQGKGSIDGSGMFWGQQFTGDFTLTALQTNATSNAMDARSGIMIRDCMDNGAMAFLGRNPQGAFSSFVWRTNPKGGTSGLNGITQKRRWLRLIRRGTQITALHAPDNAGVPGAWVQLGLPQTVFLQPTVVAGLYCDNAGGVGFNVANFSRFSVVPLNTAPIVNAGVPPTNAASPLALAGAVTDDGLPAPFTAWWSAAAAPSPVIFADSNALATAATLASVGEYTLRLWADDGIARSFDDLNFSYAGSPFAAWQATNFVGGAANLDAAPEADPDRDGLNNAGEYAFGTNPNLAGPRPIIASCETVGSEAYFCVTVFKNPAATDATIAVESSAELFPPAWSGAGLIVEEDTATTLRVRHSAPLSESPRRFLRVKVTLAR
ncbi:MAG: PKD domain-containing protein [Verrucomicrobia bacterium]|nr:PKD domain-containing protein [Verrucomicrobiota bacterium]